MKIEAKTEFLDIDLGYQKLRNALLSVGQVVSKAGLVSGKTPKEVVEYGAANHFGVGGRPERPFLTYAWDGGGESVYSMLLVVGLETWLHDPSTGKIEDLFEGVAEMARDDIVASISDWDDGPKQLTDGSKSGDPDPLIDTGRLRASIEYDVKASDKKFKEELTAARARSLLAAPKSSKRGGGAKKRKRKTSLRKRAAGLGGLGKSPGYAGKGIRKRAEGRSSAAAGVTSRGVRRKGSAF